MFVHLQDEFLDIIYWGRQIFSIIMGLVWGVLGTLDGLFKNYCLPIFRSGLTGFFGIALFGVVNSAIVYAYSINYNEDPDDALTAVKEGFMTAFASFLVTWILMYTHLYHWQ